MNKFIKKFLIIFIFFLAAQILPNSARADMDPPPTYSEGGILLPESDTDVSMEYEKVTITYSLPKSDEEYFMTAHATAVFKMKNNGTADENLMVSFPADDKAFAGGISYEEKDITNFKVNGKFLAESDKTTVPAIIGGKEQDIAAYRWQQSFPAQKETEVQIEYDTKSGKYLQMYYITYVLGTGRGWQGDIKEGEVNFILPEEVAPYSIVKEGPSVNGNAYPYKIFGKTITVSFSNYEPLSDAVILYAVFDPAIVKKIEDLKKKPATFFNTLEIAALYRKLAQGVHCEFCVNEAADLAIDYYNSAIEKAVARNELDAALLSSVYGDYGENIKIADLLGSMQFKECADADHQCIEYAYGDRGGPFGDGVYLDTEILNNYALKAGKYDSSIHNQVVAFSQKIGGLKKWELEKEYQYNLDQAQTEQEEAAEEQNLKESNQISEEKTENNFIGFTLIGLVIVLAGTAILIIVKRNINK